jgi:hypothetical protein
VTAALPRAVPIAGAGIVSAHGVGFEGLARAARAGTHPPGESAELRASHAGTRSFELAALPEPKTAAERRARAMMSRGAVLACAAVDAALDTAAWGVNPEEVGVHLAVGASGGSLAQLDAMLDASIVEHEFSLARFGDAGLRACNPLFAFQLMQNFTLCHSAIVHGTRGPNAAYYSRGAGTVTALREAAYSILDGDCPRALAGGADSAVHAVTWAELVREGFAARGLVPGEGAAVLALGAPSSIAPRAFLERATVWPSRGRDLKAVLFAGAGDLSRVDTDAVVVAPWGPPARDELTAFIAEKLPERRLLDASLVFGEALAAGPALAWVLALDLLREERLRRVSIVSAGLDGDVGIVRLCSGGEA